MQQLSKRQTIIAYRLFFSGLVVIAAAAQLAHLLVRPHASVLNFFSYFTIQSNLFAAVVLVMSAYMLYKKREDKELESLRGAATLYLLVTGIIYIFFLSQAQVEVPKMWVNVALHYIMPVVMLADWLYDPPKRSFTHKDKLRWLIYPLLYTVYTLVRGPLAHDRYPYPFINAAKHGYPKVIAACLGIGLLMFGLATLLCKVSNKTTSEKVVAVAAKPKPVQKPRSPKARAQK